MVIAFLRTIILYLFIIVGIRLMGKRQVGELEPSELVLSLLIADLAAVPMQDFGIPLLTGLIPILTLLSLLQGMGEPPGEASQGPVWSRVPHNRAASRASAIQSRFIGPPPFQ